MPKYVTPATGTVAGSLSGKTVGRFAISERLGKGGMGEVYRAEDTRLKRTVALKRLSPSLRSDPLYRRRFQEEAERASRFTDAHVAAIYDVIDEQDETLLVMEYVEGQTLRQRLRQPMSLDEFLQIAIQCAEALVAANHAGIVHCDIKPENIMLTPSGRVKILDFGVAKFLPRSDQSSTVERSGTVGGTPAYMSPEVLLEKTPDGRADIFSLGIVLYEALSGHHPFLSDSYVATTHRILHEKLTPIRVFNAKVPEELERVVEQCLAKAPADRYSNAQDLLDDLQSVQAGVTPSKLLPRPLLQRAARANRWVSAALALIVALGIGYGIYRWTHRGPVLRERGWALITDFDTSGDDPIPDKGVREGLTIALQQSPYVNVYPRTRVYEALQRMKRADATRIDETLGREICRRENLQVLLTGSIEHLGQAFQLTVRAIDPNTGNLLFAEKEHFKSKDQFFDETDKVARAVRKDLGESINKIERTSRPLAKVTTNSFDALQLYSEASDLMASGNVDAVPGVIQAALQLDPSFAMGHLLLGQVFGRMGNRKMELGHLQRAYDTRNSTSDREQRLIEASYYEVKGEYEQEVGSLKILVGLHPDDSEAHQNLAYAYRNVGDTNRAIDQLREVLNLDSNSIRPYVELVRFLARVNRNEEAVDTYQQAIDHGWNTPTLHWGRGLALLGQGRTADAMHEFEQLQETNGLYQSTGRIYLARTLMYEGKLKEAASLLQAGIIADHSAKSLSYELLGRYLLASSYIAEERLGSARAQLYRIVASSDRETEEPGDLVRVGTLYARIGDTGSAEGILSRLRDVPSGASAPFTKACREIVTGEIASAHHNYGAAVRLFSAANDLYPMVLSHQSLARVYQIQGDWVHAIVEWQKVLAAKGEILQDHSPIDWVLAHLELARAYSLAKDFTSAEQRYTDFLKIWNGADPLPATIQAHAELQTIRMRQNRGAPIGH